MDGPPSEAEGIYRARFDPAAGTLSELTLVAEVGISPSWFRWHPSKPILYTTNETFDGSPSSVTAFRLTPSAGLERLSRVSTGGGSACHFSVHPRLRYIAAANHGQDFGGTAGGSVAVLSVCPTSGDLLEQTDFILHESPSPDARPAGRDNWTPHAHSANWSPCGRFLFVCEKGTDRIIVYAFDEEHGKLKVPSETMVTVGGGARHLTIHPDLEHIYVNEEAGAKVTMYTWDAGTGKLTPHQTLSTLPDGCTKEVFTSECALGPSGRVLYVANRVWPPVPGEDKGWITSYEIGADSKMTLLGFTEVGRHPRHFQIDPSGSWMLCVALHEHRVDIFKLDERGVPQPTDKSLAMPTPTHALWLDPTKLTDLGAQTTTSVIHPDGTKVEVTTSSRI